jgi:DnaA family protein
MARKIAMTAETAQLTLPVHLRDDATLANYLFPDQLGPLAVALRNQLSPAGESIIYLHGPAGTGRTHLLQAGCQALPAGEALYLPLMELRDLPADEVLVGLEGLSRVCLDDIQLISGSQDWEHALFHLINRARETGCKLVVAGDRPPRQLSLALADLGSRLEGGVVFQLPELTDAQKLKVLILRAEGRGLQLNEEAGRYILSRASRHLADLMQLLEQLDRDSMAAQRQLTVPFIKARLGW